MKTSDFGKLFSIVISHFNVFEKYSQEKNSSLKNILKKKLFIISYYIVIVSSK